MNAKIIREMKEYREVATKKSSRVLLQVCQFNDGWIIAWEVICGAQNLFLQSLDINGNVSAFYIF